MSFNYYRIFRQSIKVIQVQGHFKDGRHKLRYGCLVKCGVSIKLNSMLAVKRSKVKIADAEVPGRSLKKILQRLDPFKGKKCEDPDKYIVCTGGGRGCRSNGVTYEVKCKK